MLLSNGRLSGIAPQALGEITPLTSTGYFYPNASGVQLERQFATYAAMYRTQMWVSTVVDKVADSLARLSVSVWDESQPSGNFLDNTSLYARLLAQPNAEMSSYDFWRWVAATLEIYGETFLMKVRNDRGQVVQLLPMHPARIAIRRAPDSGDTTYVFTTGASAASGLLELPADDVIPFLRFNPDNLMRGVSRLESLRSTLASEDSARRVQGAMFANQGRPGMVLSTDKALSREAKGRLKESFDSAHSGSDNAGGTVVLSDGLTALPFQLSATDLAYIQTRTLNREEVCARYDVPPPVVHILDHATYSNITEQMRSMYRDTMAPRIEHLESAIDSHLGQDFPGTRRARFNVSDILRGDIDQRATTAGMLVERGIAKPSEVRPWFDLGDAGPVADKLYANAAIQELGHPAERISITDNVVAPPEQVAEVDDALVADGQQPSGAAPASPPPPKPLPAQRDYARELRGRMGRGKSLSEALRDSCLSHPGDEDLILAAAGSLATEGGTL